MVNFEMDYWSSSEGTAEIKLLKILRNFVPHHLYHSQDLTYDSHTFKLVHLSLTMESSESHISALNMIKHNSFRFVM